jgi:hypothetical protein
MEHICDWSSENVGFGPVPPKNRKVFGYRGVRPGVILDVSYCYLLEDGGLLSRTLALRVREKDSQGASRKKCIPIAKLAIDSLLRLNMRNCRKPL